MEQRVPILVYHHVYPEGHPDLGVTSNTKATGIIGEAEFRRHLQYIDENGWNVVSTSHIVDHIEHGSPLPERAVALHFDNGWLDTYSGVRPILKEHGIVGGICYIISEPTAAASEGKPAGIQTTTEGYVLKPFLTWDHAKEMLDEGWEIGAHTATHPKLAEVHKASGDAGVLAEVGPPNETFERHLGFVPEHFAYPSGSRNERTDALLSPHYRSLRLWTFSVPPQWAYTTRSTSPKALECQNVDNTVPFEDFTRIFTEALGR
ncbi:MAG: polysaccharide deacetylase family protein [Chloroflexi bacterium]|nr:polysaccharide deacetylase family protein [Chloroflexota bacterium]